MIMVGPGTGISPFVGFLEERGPPQRRAPTGCSSANSVRLRTSTIASGSRAWSRQDTLTRLDTAFSRDQRSKIYVQDRMREHGARLWEWIDAGAHFYVCGDATRMAKDVDAALRDIVARHGAMGEGEAYEYVKRMLAEKRYVRDVY